MKEALFVNRNAQRWQEFESLLEDRVKRDPDKLAELFVQLTDDLSYARTFYPESRTVSYLNALTAKAHQAIYKRKRESTSRFVTFWTQEIPREVHHARGALLLSLAFFGISFLIGVVSTLNDTTFARLILGDFYVDMTLANIDQGDPMAVYKEMHQTDMFLGITINNIRVALFAFALGAFFSAGTAYILFHNGVMVGTFQYFFNEHGLLAQSAAVIWIHGTIEISAIVVAGGAGFVMGNSLLFPGTYSRSRAFLIGARRGLKIVIGLVPFFIVAGFLESFVTRYTRMPLPLSIGIIGLSLAIIIGYFVVLPWHVARRDHVQRPIDADLTGVAAVERNGG